MWETIDGFQEPTLRHLADSLKGTILRSREPKQIDAFSEAYGEIVFLPIREACFALYLQHVGGTTGLRSAVEEVVNAVG